MYIFTYRFSKPDEAFMFNTTDALRSVCLANKSMTFLALDSNHHYHTAKVFGINLNHYRERTAIVIYDMKVFFNILCRKIRCTTNCTESMTYCFCLLTCIFFLKKEL